MSRPVLMLTQLVVLRGSALSGSGASALVHIQTWQAAFSRNQRVHMEVVMTFLCRLTAMLEISCGETEPPSPSRRTRTGTAAKTLLLMRRPSTLSTWSCRLNTPRLQVRTRPPLMLQRMAKFWTLTGVSRRVRCQVSSSRARTVMVFKIGVSPVFQA